MAQTDKPVLKENVGQAKKDADARADWWNVKPDDVYRHLFATIEKIESRQGYRTAANFTYARMYADVELTGFYSGLYNMEENSEYVYENRISLNVVKSAIDTATAKIAKAKPRPLFLTEGGNYKLQQKAKRLTKFLDGAFDEMDLYAQKQKSFRDAGIFGTGVVKFYPDVGKSKVCCERILSEELVVDDADGLYGRPMMMAQKRLVHKDKIRAMFPEAAKSANFQENLEKASELLQESMHSDMAKDLVKVIEAWKIPTSKESGDGKKVMAISTMTLDVQSYEKDYFPFVFDRWDDKVMGFFGTGICEEGMGLQMAINTILMDIEESMNLVAKPRVLQNAQTIIAQINNEIGSILKWSGSHPPEFSTPMAMSPDVYNHLWNLVSKFYETLGVSQMSATSQKPAGLNSGAALREYQDIESDRYQIVAQRYEKSFLDAAIITVDMMKDLEKENKGKVKVKVQDQGAMKYLKFSDVDLDEDKYMMRVFPTSILPTQPAGKLQTVTELIQAGFVDKETGMDLLDFPDLQSALSRQLAPRRLINKILDNMVEDGKYRSPEPYMNLQMALQISTDSYLFYQEQEVDEESLELIRRFISDINSLTQIAAQGAPMPPMGPGAQPGAPPIAQPVAPPTSDIMPIQGEQAPI